MASTSVLPRTTEIATSGITATPALLSSGAASGSSTAPDFLAVILDLNPYVWSAAALVDEDEENGLDTDDAQDAMNGERVPMVATRALAGAVDEICIFLNAHAAMQHENAVAVYAAGLGKGTLLYQTQGPGSSSNVAAEQTSQPDANTYQHFKALSEGVSAGVYNVLEAMSTRASSNTRQAPIGMVSALSQALCHINRLSNGTDTAISHDPDGSGKAPAHGASRKRILVLSVSPDASEQYVSIMNCIFAAQKRGVAIDVLKLMGTESVFLQQAAHLTGGSYFRLAHRRGLLQTLMSTYLPSLSIRHLLHLPNQDEVDFRAACFCHRRIVDVGYICSVCLSIFCTPREKCITCDAKFPPDTLARYKAERRAMGLKQSEVEPGVDDAEFNGHADDDAMEE